MIVYGNFCKIYGLLQLGNCLQRKRQPCCFRPRRTTPTTEATRLGGTPRPVQMPPEVVFELVQNG